MEGDNETKESQERFATLHQTQISAVYVCVFDEESESDCQQRCRCTTDQTDSLEWLQMKQYITLNQQQYIYSCYSAPFSESQTWRIMVSEAFSLSAK